MLAQADDALGAGIPSLLAQLGHELDERASKEKELHSSFMDSGVAAVVSVRSDASAARMGGGGGGVGAGAAATAESPAAGAGGASSGSNPFGGGGGGASDAYSIWAAMINKAEADSVMKLQPGGMEGRLSGSDAKDVLLESGLDVAQLRQIWDLSDTDKDGFLDRDEFAVAWYLITAAKLGKPLPATLPTALVPPNKKLPA